MRNKIYLKYALSFRTLSGSARGNKEIQIRVSIQRIQQIVKSSRKKKKLEKMRVKKLIQNFLKTQDLSLKLKPALRYASLLSRVSLFATP